MHTLRATTIANKQKTNKTDGKSLSRDRAALLPETWESRAVSEASWRPWLECFAETMASRASSTAAGEWFGAFILPDAWWVRSSIVFTNQTCKSSVCVIKTKNNIQIFFTVHETTKPALPAQDQIRAISMLCLLLPHENRNTMRELLNFFKLVVELQSFNKMSIHNVATITGKFTTSRYFFLFLNSRFNQLELVGLDSFIYYKLNNIDLSFNIYFLVEISHSSVILPATLRSSDRQKWYLSSGANGRTMLLVDECSHCTIWQSVDGAATLDFFGEENE